MGTFSSSRKVCEVPFKHGPYRSSPLLFPLNFISSRKSQLQEVDEKGRGKVCSRSSLPDLLCRCPSNPAPQDIAVDASSIRSAVEISIDLRFSETSPDDIASMEPPQDGKTKDENDRGRSPKEPSLGPIISDHQPQLHPQPPAPLDEGMKGGEEAHCSLASYSMLLPPYLGGKPCISQVRDNHQKNGVGQETQHRHGHQHSLVCLIFAF